MAKVRVRPETGTLYLDFFYRGVRCREQTALPETAENLKKVQALLNRIQKDIARGAFDYAQVFPGSPRAAQFADSAAGNAPSSSTYGRAVAGHLSRPPTPLFAEFVELWFLEMSPQWRQLHRGCVREVINKHLLPTFGKSQVGEVTKADVLAFRARIAELPGRKGKLGNARINKIMCFLRQILNEAADRFEVTPAFRSVKPLKQKKADVQPFSLDEVNRILDTVRADYRNYLVVRFFTGMRTGEVNGLQWKYIDLERNLILVRESVVAGEVQDDTKNQSSMRDIPMQPLVREAILAQQQRRKPDVRWVFPSREGGPVDAHNFTNRVWYPLLRYLELEKRRPYQTRHTAATLMLASGENPEWIAKTLGHSNTDMLFRIYSRFVPNLTRQDGRAFAGLIHSRLTVDAEPPPASMTPADLAAMNSEQLRAALAELLAANATPAHNAPASDDAPSVG